MTNAVRFVEKAQNGPSYRLWADCPWNEGDPTVGYGFFEDFCVGGLITSPTTSAALVGKNFSGFGDTGSTITYSDELGGGIKLLSDGTENDCTSIFSLSHCFQMGLTKEPLWFEASVKPSSLLIYETGIFVGLADSTAKTTAVPLTAAAGALADLNLVGLHSLDTDIGVLKSCYKSDGVTAVDVESYPATTLAEATYVKLGFKKDRDGIVRWFVDGVEQNTTFQTLNDLGTGFPGDVTMAPCISMAVGEAAGEQTLHVRWCGCYQLRA